MAKIRLMIELTYDKELNYDVLAKEALALHSNLLGDMVGEVRVLCCNRSCRHFDWMSAFYSREPRRCSEILGILNCRDYFVQVEE